MRTPSALLLGLGLLGLAPACGEEDTGDADLPACGLAGSLETCNECYSGEVTCTYDEWSETAGSCGDCQARSALYAALCEAGVEDSAATIEAETTCSEPQ